MPSLEGQLRCTGISGQDCSSRYTNWRCAGSYGSGGWQLNAKCRSLSNTRAHSWIRWCSLDLIVERSVVVEVKSVETLAPIHRAQLLTYLKLTGLRVGLIINFNVELLHSGVRRMLNG